MAEFSKIEPVQSDKIIHTGGFHLPHVAGKDISASGHYFLSRQPNKALEAWSVNSLSCVAALKEV